MRTRKKVKLSESYYINIIHVINNFTSVDQLIKKKNSIPLKRIMKLLNEERR